MKEGEMLVQIQIKKIAARIDQLEERDRTLEVELTALQDEVFGLPKNKKHRAEVLRDIKKSLQEIKNGKYHTYKSVKEFDAAIWARK